MNKQFLETLNLYNFSIRGIALDSSLSCDANKMLSFAKSQGIWNSVFLSIKTLHKNNQIQIDDGFYQALNKQFIAQYGRQEIRYSLFHRLAKQINENGITFCILKGESVARYYNNPLLRISSDIDLLVRTEEELEKLTEILLDNGFSLYESERQIHHISFTHPQIGLLEVHTQMYSNMDNDLAMDNMITYDEPWVEFVTEDGTAMQTLGYTDNFLFLFVHYLKHFWKSGVSIRHLTDILLYVENEYSNIDWDRANDLLDKLSFRYFFVHLIAIGERYFDFPKDLFDTSSVKDELIEKILTDIEKGGVWGRNEKERKGFAAVFFQKRYEKLHPESRKKVEVGDKKRFFPGREYMSINYKYVEKSVLLMPIAWVHRVFDVLIRRRRMKPVHDERLKLLRDLEII